MDPSEIACIGLEVTNVTIKNLCYFLKLNLLFCKNLRLKKKFVLSFNMLEFRCYGCHEPYFVRFGSVYKNLTDKRRDRQTDIQMDKPQTTDDQKNTFEPSVQVGLKFTCTALSYFLTLL